MSYTAPDTRGRGRGRHRVAMRQDRHNLPLLWAGQFVNTAGLMMLVPIMPFYLERMRAAPDPAAVPTWAGVAIAAPALALVVATPLWGRVGDRIGRKWMVVRALLGLAASMVVMAIASTPLALVAGRLLQGTLGGVVEAAAGFAGTTGRSGGRGAALGKSFSATAAGSLVGPLAGGALVGAGELSALMLAIAGVAAILAGLCALGLREPAGPAGEDVEATGTAPRSAAPEATPPGRLAGRLPVTASLAAAAALAYLGVYGLIPVFADYTRTLVEDPRSAGLWVGVAQSLTWGATLVTSPLWGRHNDASGRPVRAFAVAAAGCGVAIAAQALPIGLFGVLALRTLQGACFAALAQSLFLHASQRAARDRAGGAVGSSNSFLLTGQSVGPQLAGPLVSLTPTTVTIAALGGSCLSAALLAIRAATAEAPPAAEPARSSADTTTVPTIELAANPGMEHPGTEPRESRPVPPPGTRVITDGRLPRTQTRPLVGSGSSQR